jgi:hypothetical protein
MDNYQKFGLVSGQVLMGLIFGFGGAIVTALIMDLYNEVSGKHYGDLSTSIFYFFFGGGIGSGIGIAYDGYKYLKDRGRLNDFKRFFGQSIIGLSFGLFIFYSWSPVAFAFPMIGAIIGFDFGLIKKRDESERKTS